MPVALDRVEGPDRDRDLPRDRDVAEVEGEIRVDLARPVCRGVRRGLQDVLGLLAEHA